MSEEHRAEPEDDLFETDDIEDKDNWNMVKKWSKQVIEDEIEEFDTQIKPQGSSDPKDDSLEGLLADAAIPSLVAKSNQMESFLP